MSTKFYDTNALLKLLNKSFDEPFVCSSKTLEEIEHIKVSDKKDQEIKYKARILAHLLDNNQDKYEVVITNNDVLSIINEFNIEVTPDNIIIAAAYDYSKTNDITFITNDICCKIVAKNVFGLKVDSVKESNDVEYKGFIEKLMSEEEMSYFYSHLKENIYNLLINEYLIVKKDNGDFVEAYRWDGETYASIYKKQIKSMAFGDKLKAKDIYQSLTIDSIMHNNITAISGKAGSGKSLLALMCAMHLVETGKYDRLVILHNPTPVRGAQQLGYYTGSALDKAMQSNIGNILITKFGDRYAIDTLIQQDKLKIINMTDCRGTEIRDNEILWITEAENTSVDLMKICLSRVSNDAKVIVEGDYAQIDNPMFMNGNNGFLRMINVLKDKDMFGYVQLQNVWRSKLAELVDAM